MTSIARRFGVIQFMTVQAAIHGGYAGYFGHRSQLRHRAVTGLTFYASGEVSAMIPFDAG